jgi:hypothetical protein
VAIGGLMVSTFLTLLYVPIFYTIFEDLVVWLARMKAKIGSHGKVTALSDNASDRAS